MILAKIFSTMALLSDTNFELKKKCKKSKNNNIHRVNVVEGSLKCEIKFCRHLNFLNVYCMFRLRLVYIRLFM